MRYLECRHDRSGYGTFTKALINTGLFDYYIIYDGYDCKGLEANRMVTKDIFISNILPKLTCEDIVLFTCNDIEGMPEIELSKCIKILTLHDITPLRVDYLSKRKKSQWRHIVGKAVKVCDYIITVSEFSKRDIKQEFGLGDKKIFVVYSYAQDVSGLFNEDDYNELREDTLIKSSKYVISTVASMNPNKNFPRVIKAWKKSKYYNESVLIAMSKKNSIPFKLFLLMRGVKKKVYVPGYVSITRLSSLYRCSDLFIFTTIREGFGVPPIEAMQLETPVLTSNTSCMEEILGDSALFVDPFSVKEIQRGIERILDNESIKKQLIARGLEQSFNYSESRFYDELIYVLDQVYLKNAGN